MVILHFFVYSLFCASGIILCMPGCLAVATSLATLEKQAHANFCATVLSQRRNNHTPSPQYAAFHVLQLRMLKTGSQYLLANTGTSMLDRHKKTFLGQQPCTMQCMRKLLSTLNFDFSRKCNGGIETIIKFIYHVEKTSRKIR